MYEWCAILWGLKNKKGVYGMIMFSILFFTSVWIVCKFRRHDLTVKIIVCHDAVNNCLARYR